MQIQKQIAEPNSQSKATEIDREASEASEIKANSPIVGLELETQAQAPPSKQGKKYLSMIAIGLVSVLAAALIVLGVSNLYLNKGKSISSSALSRMDQVLEHQATPTMLISDVECTKRQLIDKNGECKTCGEFTIPDEARKECITPVCDNPEEVVFIDGTCMKCFPYTQPGPGRIGCIYPQCGEREQIGFSGFCQECPDFKRSINSKITCEEPLCKDRFKITKLGTCEKCPDNYVTTEDLKDCVLPTYCDVRERITKEGTCEQCPDYHRTLDDPLTCEMPKCSGREQLMPDGTCQKCPAYQKAIEGGKACEVTACEARQKVLPDATCETCPAFQKPDWTGMECESPTCGEREKQTTTGGCEKCGPYQRIICEGEESCDLTTCKEPTCGPRQKVIEDGSCESCPPFTAVLTGGRQCERPVCGDREKIMPDGSCQLCDPFTVVDNDGTGCVKQECRQDEVFDRDGACKACDPFTIVSEDRLQCLVPECGKREVIIFDGQCEECKPYTIPNPMRRDCVTPKCQARERIMSNGQCRICADYTIVSADGKTCEAPRCGENETITRNGGCQACDRYSVVSKDRKSCIAPECVDRQFITKDGSCQQCPAYTRTAEDKMSCEAPQCPDKGDSINADGECHDYDDTLEQRHDDLKRKSIEMGQVLIKMDQKMNELLAELQQEAAAKEDWQRKYEDEKATAAEYLNERNALQTQLGETRTKLTDAINSYDQQNQVMSEMEQKLTSETASLAQCSKAKDNIETLLGNSSLLQTECQSKLSAANENLKKFSAEKEAAYLESIEACEAKYTELQHEKRMVEQDVVKYKTDVLEKMKEKKTLTATYERKFEIQEKIMELQLTDMKKKALEVQMKNQEAYMNMKGKLQQCQLEKESCSPKANQTGKYYKGYTLKQGKCRQADKVSYNEADHYNAINTRHSVATEMGCHTLCETDARCTAFHYYHLDPGALDNCNIWTATGYSGNGSKTSKCYTKDTLPSAEDRDAAKQSTDCARHGDECIECDNNFEVGACSRCIKGFWVLGGLCYETVAGWGS